MSLRILFCASEVSPYAKTGGLADVAAALPQALAESGCDVRILMPLYRCARDRVESARTLKPEEAPSGPSRGFPIPVGVHDFHVQFRETRTDSGIPLYLLEKDELFDRSHLYGNPAHGDYEDNAERYITLAQSVRPLCAHLGWFPHILHSHDWQAGLVAAYFHYYWARDPRFASTGTVFTIHNLGYQGLFPAACFSLTHLPPEAFSVQGLEFWGQCNFLKAGLVYADFLTTVSPAYSREIQQPGFGHGLEGLLQERSFQLEGILNGVDYSQWSPETDTFLAASYNAGDLGGKSLCKEGLLRELDLPPDRTDQPLFAMISRLDVQKGFDLLLEIIDTLMSLPLTLVILGTGDASTESRLRETAARHPDRCRVLIRFDEGLAHRMEAGADFFLMPSRYEPCGLNQLYSLRYGTIPVVHATGGLEDSITDLDSHPDHGNGFKFRSYRSEALLQSIRSALELFEVPERMETVRRRAMTQDFSWKRSAEAYRKLYERVLEEKKVEGGIVP